MNIQPKKRKIVKVVNHVKMEDEDQLDVQFWLQKTPAERLSEVASLRKNYFTWLNGSFPVKIKIVVQKREL